MWSDIYMMICYGCNYFDFDELYDMLLIYMTFVDDDADDVTCVFFYFYDLHAYMMIVMYV